MKQSILKFMPTFGLLSLWITAALLLSFWYRSDYQIEQSIIGIPRERNYDVSYRMTNGKLVWLTLAMITAELFALYLILRPWSYHHSIRRLLIAIALFIGLLCISYAGVLGNSGYVLFHELWLFFINCMLVVCAFVSGISIVAAKWRIHSQ